MKLAFAKYEGLGNDFVLVDVRRDSLRIGPSDARLLCDRKRGVGADGVLVVGPGRGAGAASMIVLNADGSRPEMCGNGLRCVAHYLVDGAEASLLIDTDAGPRGCEVRSEGVCVDMGFARLGREPVEVAVLGRGLQVYEANLGNPHAVLFDPWDISEFERLGPALAVHERFPDGTNVEFVREGAAGELDVVVWERGVGPTEACGTGACAVAAVACARGVRAYDEEIMVRLPGGVLAVRVAPDGRVIMQGPARRVFRGEVDG
jgi:diaminopimelate epimerase